MKRILFVSLLIISYAAGVRAQSTQEEFGKNRIQHKNLYWRFFGTENFDVYFYDGGEENARIAAEFMEKEFNRITDLLGYAPYTKTKIFLYNSLTDLQQSNKGLYEVPFTIGGQTNFIKLQVEIAYPGTMASFKEELVFRTAKLLINDMMFGGSLADMFQSAYLLTLPEWFMDGAALYVAYGWDLQMDDFIRDYFTHKKFKKLKKLSGDEAKIVGQSIWNYLTLKYGRSNISNVLNLTRIIRNEQNSIASTLGIPFRQFLADWEAYYINSGSNIAANYVDPTPGSNIYKRTRDLKFNNVKMSPDGLNLAYSQNENGRYKIFIKDLATGKINKISVMGYQLINQQIDNEIPILSWIDEKTLGIVDVSRGYYRLTRYNIETGLKVVRSMQQFNQIKDIGFSSNGNLAIISADVEGRNDLFLLSLRRNAVRRLTDDIYDDVNPRFIPGTDALVFSSNRVSDSLDVDGTFEKISNNYNLFLYDLDTTTQTLGRLTNTLSKDTHPKPIDSNTIYYLSDQKGIINLFKYTISDNIFHQVSNFNSSIHDYDIVPSSNGFSYILLNRGKFNIHYTQDFDRNQNIFTPQTFRQNIEQAKFVSNRLSERAKETVDPNLEEEVEPVQSELNELLVPLLADSLINLEDIIDTENYVFDEEEYQDDVVQTESFLSNFRQFETPSEIIGPNPYETRYHAENIVTSFVIDPLRGFGILLETQMNDMLEDQRFYGGLLAISNLKSGDFFGEYELLKYKLDLNVRYDRKSLWHQVDDRNNLYRNLTTNQKYILNKVELGVQLPITTTARLVFTPFFANTRYLEVNPLEISIIGDPSPDRNNYFSGFRAEAVFDNSLTKGLNLYEGTRIKLGFHQWSSLSSGRDGFSNLFLDVRHHQKIHREISLSFKGFYGKFLGKDSPEFLLGGMNNWLIKQTDNEGDQNPLNGATNAENSNILFHQFIPLRGFNYNKFNGSNVITFSAELRIPLIRYITRGPIQSNFFRNLMFIAFYDVGSAWTGISPFKRENSVNTVTIKPTNSPFEATLRNSQSPWLASFGLGLRTVMMGYYMKFDFAKPIENFDVGKMKFYLTLGHEF
ncbi:MAG: translocation protein TolB [Bacteroidetes bacterium]|nr:translocation protein TolB [Bacteroidota bacterium]MDA1119441.1 translocation protein TolB [Bacteroidota bacterium]